MGVLLSGLWDTLGSYVLFFFLGGLVGFAELVSRYRDDPKALIGIPLVYLYMALNGIIGIAALYLIDAFGAAEPAAGGATTPEQAEIYAILLAAFGGAAFFRSSIARAKAGDMEVAVGPSFLIEAFLRATDREIDRHRAQYRARRAADLMRSVPPAFAAESLSAYCIDAMQNLAAADEKTLTVRVLAILNGDGASEIRSMRIGMVLMEFTGERLLSDAIGRLQSEIDAAHERQVAIQEGIDEDALASALADEGTPSEPSSQEEA